MPGVVDDDDDDDDDVMRCAGGFGMWLAVVKVVMMRLLDVSF